MDDLNIKIKAILASAKESDLDSQIKALSTQIKERLELKLKINAEDLEVITRQVDNIKKKIKTKTATKDSLFINPEVEQQAFSEITARLREVKRNVDELAKVRTQYSLDEQGRNKLETATITYYNKELGQTVTETMRWVEAEKMVNGELQKTRTFRTVGLDISDDMAKATREAEKTAKALEKVNLFKQRMLGGDGISGEIDILRDKYGERIDPKALDELEKRTQSLGDNLAEADLEMKKITQSTSLLTKEASQSGTVLGRMAENAFKFLRFYLVGQQIVNLVRNIREGIRYVQELDNALNRIRVITGTTQESVELLAKSYNTLGKEMGATTLEIVNGATAWFRQGKTAEEALELTKASIVESKLAAIDSAQATEYLTATLNGYKMKSEEVMTIVDQMVGIDNKAATSVSELSIALQRSSNSASDAGIELSKLLGYIGTVSSVTRKSASSIGESFKTMFARMANIQMGKIDEDGMALSDVESALNRVGIALRENETTFRNFGDVLDNVASKFGTLNELEQSNIAKSIAGVRQRENFIVLMNNYNKALELEEVALNSSGLAMERYGTFMESVEAKKNKLKATWESFHKSIFNTNVIKGFIDGLASLIGWLDKIKITVPIISGLLAGLLVVAIKGVGVALKELIAKMTALNILSGGLPILIGLIVAAVTGLGMVVSSTSSKIKDFNDESIRLVQIQKEETDTVDKLTKRYDELKEKTELTAEEKNELYDIQLKLAAIYPQTADGIGLENEKITTQIELVKQLNKEKRDGYEEDIKRLAQKGKLEMQDLILERDKLELEKSNVQSKLKVHEDFVSKYSDLYQQGKREMDLGRLSDSTINQILSIKDDRYDFSGNTIGFFSIVDEEMKSWEKFSLKISELNDKLKENKELRYKYADAIVELDKMQNPHLYGGDESEEDYLPTVKKDGEVFFPEGKINQELLEYFLNTGKITLQTYYERLLKIRKDTYSDYIGKSASELEEMSKDKDVASKIISFLTLEGKIKDAYGKMQKGETSTTPKEYSPMLSRESLKYLLDINEISLDYYYEQLLKIEEREYKGYRDKSYAQLQALLESSDEETATKAKGFVSLFGEIQKTKKTLDDNALKAQTEEAKKAIEDFEKSLLPFKNTLSDINYQIDRYNEILKQTPEEKQEPILLKINELLEQKKNTLHELNETNRAQLATLEPTSEEYRKLEAEIKATSLEWWRLDNQQRANIKTMDDYVAKLEELSKKEKEERRQKVEQQKKEAKELIDSYRNYIVEGINEEIEALEKSKRAAKDAADAKIAAIQKQIEILERQNAALKEQEDREKRLSDLAKQREKVANIEKNRDTRMLIDGEWVYVANPRKLREETERLAEMEEDYIKWERDLKDKKVIEDLRSQIKAIQDSLKEEEKGYDKRIEQLREFIKDQNKLWNRQEDQITSYEQLLDRLSEYEKEIYIDRLKELNNFVSEYNKLTSTLSPIPSTSSGGSTYTPTSSESTSSSIQMWNPTTKQLSTVSAHAVSKYQQMGWTTNVPTDEELRKMIEKLKGFDTGGYTGTWGKDGKLAFLHEKEIVLKQDDTTNLLKGITMLRDIVPTLKSIQFKVPELQFPKAALAGAGATNYYVNINKVETPDAESFMDLVPTLALQYRNKR